MPLLLLLAIINIRQLLLKTKKTAKSGGTNTQNITDAIFKLKLSGRFR